MEQSGTEPANALSASVLKAAGVLTSGVRQPCRTAKDWLTSKECSIDCDFLYDELRPTSKSFPARRQTFKWALRPSRYGRILSELRVIELSHGNANDLGRQHIVALVSINRPAPRIVAGRYSDGPAVETGIADDRITVHRILKAHLRAATCGSGGGRVHGLRQEIAAGLKTAGLGSNIAADYR